MRQQGLITETEPTIIWPIIPRPPTMPAKKIPNRIITWKWKIAADREEITQIVRPMCPTEILIDAIAKAKVSHVNRTAMVLLMDTFPIWTQDHAGNRRHITTNAFRIEMLGPRDQHRVIFLNGMTPVVSLKLWNISITAI